MQSTTTFMINRFVLTKQKFNEAVIIEKPVGYVLFLLNISPYEDVDNVRYFALHYFDVVLARNNVVFVPPVIHKNDLQKHLENYFEFI